MNRRAFLLGSTAAVASVAVPLPSFAQKMTAEEILNEVIGLLGRNNYLEFDEARNNLIMFGACKIEIGTFEGFKPADTRPDWRNDPTYNIRRRR